MCVCVPVPVRVCVCVRESLRERAAEAANTLTVVPGLCDEDRNGVCDVADIDALTQKILVEENTFEDLERLVVVRRDVVVEDERGRLYRVSVWER